MKIFNQVVLGFLIIICLLGTFYKHISFGLGLGDIFGYAILFIGVIIHAILTYVLRNKSNTTHGVLGFTFLVFTILVLLNATLWRGREYPWNGQIFYMPCPKKIAIKNKKTEKDILVTMCSMTYHSKLSGTWNGKGMINIEGEIKIPDKLVKYIDYPIETIYIKPKSFNRVGVDQPIKEFEIEDLTIEEKHSFWGEIISIKDRKPVFRVRIK